MFPIYKWRNTILVSPATADAVKGTLFDFDYNKCPRFGHCLTFLVFLIMYAIVLRLGSPVSQYVSYRMEHGNTQH